MAETANGTASSNAATDHSGHWLTTINHSGLLELQTANTFLDRNIDVQIPEATTSSENGSVTVTDGSVSVSGMETVDGDTGFSVTATGGTASVTASSISATTGFVNSAISASTAGKSSTGNSQTKYIKAETITTESIAPSGSVSAGSIIPEAATYQYVHATTGYNGTDQYIEIEPMSKGTSANYILSGSGSASISSVAVAEDDDGYYVSGSATGSGTVKLTGKIGGYLAADASKSTSIAPTASVKAYIAAGSLSHTATDGVTYSAEAGSNTVIPANGTLYINEGWHPNTSISLAHLIPDPTGTNQNPGTDQLRSGYSAFDGEGNQIVGTMADAVVSIGKPQLSMTIDSVSYGSYSYVQGFYNNATDASVADYVLPFTPSVSVTGTTPTKTISTTGYLGTDSQITASSIDQDLTATEYIGFYGSSLSSFNVENSYSTVTPTYNKNKGGYIITTPISASVTTTAGIMDSGTKSLSDTSADVAVITAGTATPNVSTTGTSAGTINAGSQIKISAGWYPSDLYYTAQSASATTRGTVISSFSDTTSSSTSYDVSSAVSSSTPTSGDYLTITATPSVSTAGYISSTDGTRIAASRYMKIYGGTYTLSY